MKNIAVFAFVLIVFACNGKAKMETKNEAYLSSKPQVVTCDDKLINLILSCSNFKTPFNKKNMHAEVEEEVKDGIYLIRLFEYGTGVESTSTQGWLRLNVNDTMLEDVTTDPVEPIILKYNPKLFNAYIESCLEKKVDRNDLRKLSNCPLVGSNETLPYDKLIDIKTVKYNLIESKFLKGVSEFLCDGGDKLRYLPLPNKGDISLILVPMDCGDFEYRFYLLTIKDCAIISSLYVEGVWYEPGGDESEEVTSFTIDENFSVKVKTTSLGSPPIVKTYTIRDDGKIVED